MSTHAPAKPRPADVARWVATLAAPMPDHFLRADYRRATGERCKARGNLAAWGLDEHGAPRFPFLAPAEPAPSQESSDALAASLWAMGETAGDPWTLTAGVPSGAGAAPLSGPCCDGSEQ